MPQPTIWRAEVYEGDDFTFMDRIVSRAFRPLLEAEIVSINLRGFRLHGDRIGKKLLDEISPSGYWSDTLLTDEGWERDTVGRNFTYTLAYDDFKVQGGTEAQYEFLFKTASLGTIPSVWIVTYKELLSR